MRLRLPLENGYLTISAAERSGQRRAGKRQPVIISAGSVTQEPASRSFYVGEDVQQEDVKAEFKHGILKLFVPKKEAKPAVEEKKHIAIEG